MSSEMKVQYVNRTHVAGLAGKGETRYSRLNGVRVTDSGADDGMVRLEATDGRAAVGVLAEGRCEGDVSVPVSVAKHTGKRAMRVELNGQWTNGRGKCAPDEIEGMWPDVGNVIPESAPENAVLVGVNAEYLLKVAKALNEAGSEHPNVIRMLVSPDADGVVRSPILVLGGSDCEVQGAGVVMPLNSGDKRERKYVESKWKEMRKAVWG